MRGFIASLEKMHLFDVQKLKEEHIAELTKLKLNHANAMTEKEVWSCATDIALARSASVVFW